MEEKRYIERDVVMQYFANKGWLGTIAAVKRFPTKTAQQIADDIDKAIMDAAMACYEDKRVESSIEISGTLTTMAGTSYVLNTSPLAQEANMSENIAPITIETVTYVELPGFLPRTDVRLLTPAALSSVIARIEGQIKKFEEIDQKPMRVIKHIETLRKNLKELVNAVDAADAKSAEDQA